MTIQEDVVKGREIAKKEAGLKREPFRQYNLDEDKVKQDVFTIRLNMEEREILDKYKRLMNVKSDGKMLKMGFLMVCTKDVLMINEQKEK